MTQTRPRLISVSDLLALNNRLNNRLRRHVNRNLNRSLNRGIRHHIIQRLGSRSQHSQRATQILAGSRSNLKGRNLSENLIFRFTKLNHNTSNKLCTGQSTHLYS